MSLSIRSADSAAAKAASNCISLELSLTSSRPVISSAYAELRAACITTVPPHVIKMNDDRGLWSKRAPRPNHPPVPVVEG